MKKIIFVLFLVLLSPAILFADPADPADSAPPATAADSKEAAAVQALIEVDSTSSRFNQLDRRLSDLERDLRDQRDRTRNLERDISELKRRAYSNNSAY